MNEARDIVVENDDIEYFVNLTVMWGLECMDMVYHAMLEYHQLDFSIPEERRTMQDKYAQYNPRYKKCRPTYREIYRKKRLHYLAGELSDVGSVQEKTIEMKAKIESRFGKGDFRDLQGLYMELTKHLEIELPKLKLETELLKKEGNEDASSASESFLDKIRRAVPKKQVEKKIDEED